MKVRILTTVIGLPVLIAVLIFSDTVVLPIAAALFCALGVYEMISCVGFKKHPTVLIPSLLFALFFTFSARFIVERMGISSYFIAMLGTVTFVYVFYLFCLTVLARGKKDIAEVALAAITTVYVTVGFTSIVLLRDLHVEGLKDYGLCVFCLIFVGAWIPDGAAYFGGRAFGKHKLIPEVSPKKTVEGAVCGVIFGAVAYCVTGLVLNLLGFGTPNYIALAFTGLAVSVVSVFGDLIMSLIKRKYGIKDYGKLFPGHGGVLDRFDSVIAITTFLFMICGHPGIFSLFSL